MAANSWEAQLYAGVGLTASMPTRIFPPSGSLEYFQFRGTAQHRTAILRYDLCLFPRTKGDLYGQIPAAVAGGHTADRMYDSCLCPPTEGAQEQDAAPAPDMSSLPDLGPAPELQNDIFLNTEGALRLSELRGKVVLLDMWTFG